MRTLTTVSTLTAVAVALGLSGAALAQGYNLNGAPGYDQPDQQVVVAERELVQPFNNSEVTSSDAYDAPLNEFAGQRYKTDPGLIGGALGNVKRAIFGQGDAAKPSNQ